MIRLGVPDASESIRPSRPCHGTTRTQTSRQFQCQFFFAFLNAMNLSSGFAVAPVPTPPCPSRLAQAARASSSPFSASPENVSFGAIVREVGIRHSDDLDLFQLRVQAAAAAPHLQVHRHRYSPNKSSHRRRILQCRRVKLLFYRMPCNSNYNWSDVSCLFGWSTSMLVLSRDYTSYLATSF